MPIYISTDLYLSSFTGRPLNHPRIGWQTWTRDDASIAVASSSEVATYEDDNVLTENTYEWWQPTSLPATLTFTLSSAQDVNYVGIAAHTMGTNNCAYKWQYHDGSGWEDLVDASTTSNEPIMGLFDSVNATQFRLNILSGDDEPLIGVVYFGEVLESERGIYVGHSPITLAKKTIIRPNKSEDGNWLGRSVIRQGAANGIEIDNLSASWVRTYLKPFMESAVSYPFFFAWNPQNYPSEVGYCWTNSDIVPQNTGPRDLMSVSFNVEAYID